jgi:arylsulfatase A-like enzyme
VLIYGTGVIELFFLGKWIEVVFLIYLISFVLFIYLGTKVIDKIVGFLKRDKLRKLQNNIIFLVCVFVIVSFFMDLYSIQQIPRHFSDEKVEDFPNVILITLDTLRADHLSTYGYEFTTSPYLDALAEESVVFENGISPSSWTIPAHASLFTGKYPSNHNANRLHYMLDKEEVTLAELLKDKGFITAGFIAGPFCQAKYGFGQGFMTYKDRLDFFEYDHSFNKLSIRNLGSIIFKGLFDKFRPKAKDVDKTIKSKETAVEQKDIKEESDETEDGFISSITKVCFKMLKAAHSFDKILFRIDNELTSEQVNEDVFEWLDKNKDQRFFMFINYFDVHSPYLLGEEHREKFTNGTMTRDDMAAVAYMKRYETNISEEILNNIIGAYDTEIYYLDINLQKLFDKLDELEIKEDTVIIITSDHGEEFFDHGDFGHAHTVYEEVIHVPLIIHYPKEFEPKRIEKRVGTTNIFSTILKILEIQEPDDIDSVSLMPLIMNETGYERDYTFAEVFGRIEWADEEIELQKAISYNEWKIIETSVNDLNLPPGLFNLEDDPGELESFYYDEEALEEKEFLQELLINITN